MIIDLIRLKNDIDEYIELDEVVEYSPTFAQNTELIDLKETKIHGRMYKNHSGSIILDIMLDGIMILPCSITLKPVEYHFSCKICDDIEKLYEEIDKNDKKVQNSIDILPIIWENILMEMPMKVVSDNLSDAKTEGDGWKLITERENTYVNPEFEKLKDLL